MLGEFGKHLTKGGLTMEVQFVRIRGSWYAIASTEFWELMS